MKIINSKFRIWCLGFGICFSVGCGEGVVDSPGISFSETKGDAGYIQLTVNDSKSPSISKAAQIAKYKVVLEGEGLQPQEQTVSIDASGVVMEGIPAGKNRQIRVQALNSENKIIREGSLENISVAAGGVTPVSVTLYSIPVVLNVADGESLSNRRLYFHILTDPGHSISVEADRPIADIIFGSNDIRVDEKGEAKFYPGTLPPGSNQFKIIDVTTGKSSLVSLQLWDGGAIKAAPLLAASSVAKPSLLPVAQRLGQVLARASGAGVKGEELFPNIAGALWKTR